MMTNSRNLLTQLLRDLTLEESRSEKEAILFWVIEHEWKLSRTDVIAGKMVEVDDKRLRQILERLNAHEPVQYVLGETEFYGRKFTVDSSVLIPRPETELLARLVIDQLPRSGVKKVLDIGTGSGCLAITIALEAPNTNVHATDISTEALSMARHNARKLQAHVEFQIHDILSDPLTLGPLDIVVSNPPYVLESEQQDMEPNVKEFEPAVALFVPDADPLLFYKIIAEKALASLVPNGVLITEINELFGQETKALFQIIGFKEVTILQDLEGKDRFVSGIR